MQSYHVYQNSKGNWALKKDHAQRASSLHQTQSEAIQAAKNLAGNALSGVFVHSRDGRMVERLVSDGKAKGISTKEKKSSSVKTELKWIRKDAKK